MTEVSIIIISVLTIFKTRIVNCLVILSSFKPCTAQILQFGECAEVKTMEYFNLEKFLGKWYEIQRFPTWYEEDGNCAYKFINQCGRTIEIEHGFVRDEIRYILHINSTYAPGDEAVFEIKKNNIDPIGIPLTVITTDYSNFAIVYGCRNSSLLGFKIRYISAWILSREPTLSEVYFDQAFQTIQSLPNAYVAYLQKVTQSEQHCNYSWTAHISAEDKDLVDDDDELGDDD